ncbi:MAG: hypothetical protein AB7D27_14805 [Desulfomicrobium sp.]
MEKQPHHCCMNCSHRDRFGFCEDVLEPLRQDYGLTGVGPMHMPDLAYCRQYEDSEEFLEAERAAAELIREYRRNNQPADIGEWTRKAVGGAPL